MSSRFFTTLAALATAMTLSTLASAQEAPPPDPAGLQPLPADPAPPPAPPESAPATPTTPASSAPLPPPSFSRAENPMQPDADHPGERPRDKKRQPFMMSALIGYGTQSLGTTLALRVAYVAPGRFFIGGIFQYNFGETTQQGFGGFVQTTGVTYFFHQLELGYSGKVGPVEIRPYAGLGPAFGFSSREGFQANQFARPETTRATAATTPIALAVNVDVGANVYIGVDGRPIFFPQTLTPQGTFGGVVGARF